MYVDCKVEIFCGCRCNDGPKNYKYKSNFAFFTVTPPAKIIDTDRSTDTDIEIVDNIGEYIDYFLFIMFQNSPIKFSC